MICPSCGTQNRPTARFCARCGGPLLAAQPAPQPQQQAQPYSSSVAYSLARRSTSVASKATLFGGQALVTIGALIVLFAFMLPWASCNAGMFGEERISGFDIVKNPPEGNELGTLLALLPFSAVILCALGVGGAVLNLLERSLPPNLARLLSFSPLLALLPALCGCFSSCAFFTRMQQAISELEAQGFGGFLHFEYGFWLNLFGLAVVFVGILLALAGGLAGWRAKPPP